jgi:hypothetical protein
MKRFVEWFIWLSIIALMALFLGGLFYSFIVGEQGIRIDPPDWYEK